MTWCYYDIKYPDLHYPFRDVDGSGWYMFSVPVKKLAEIYKAHYHKMPKSFFDCGAAVGELIRQAEEMGVSARGIDIKRYPTNFPSLRKYEKYFQSGQIEIKSILDSEPIQADIAYCNGTLTYMNEHTLPLALQKFQHVGMLIAIHNTIEDIIAAKEMNEELLHNEPRLIQSNQWWLDTFKQNGFNAYINKKSGIFCAIPKATKDR